jgi:hypothetical protein
MLMLMVLPEISSGPCETNPQFEIGVDDAVAVDDAVGGTVFVPVGVIVGDGVAVPVLVAVGGVPLSRVGVNVRVGVRVIVGVRVTVGVFDGVEVGLGVKVGVLACHAAGGAVTMIETLTSTVRALIPSIGFPLAEVRAMNGTIRGTIGRKSPSMLTMMRVLFAVPGVKDVS